MQMWPASWSSGQSFWLLIMRSRFRFPVLPWEFFLEGENPLGNHGLGNLAEFSLRPLLVLHIHISPSTSSGQQLRLMGVPTSEVGYTSATTGRGDHEVHKGHVVALEKKLGAGELWSRPGRFKRATVPSRIQEMPGRFGIKKNPLPFLVIEW
jgi:hypothetical protein